MRKTCDKSAQCGGCAYIQKDYAYSCSEKNKQLKTLYRDFYVHVHDIQGLEPPYHYRNKAIVAFNRDYQPGLYSRHSHTIIPYRSCLLHDEKIDSVIETIGQLFKRYRVPLYDVRTRRGDVRHVVIRRAVKTDQTMITIVSTSDVFKGAKNFSREITGKHPDVKTIVLNINKRDTSIVLGDQEKILYGKGFIVDELCGLTFKISSKSFYQINHEQCVHLYEKALSLADLQHKRVIDAYCGIGTIGMIAAKEAQDVIGVELNRDAIKDANINKTFNHIPNISFVAQDATVFMQNLAKKKEKIDVVIMDPPRAGSTKEFIESVGQLSPSQVIYISCNPETQARDLKLFKKAGYHFKEVYAYDMFPFTEHVETVVLMSKE